MTLMVGSGVGFPLVKTGGNGGAGESGGLGTFTWTALQATYPNGGPVLAAMPTGVTVFVSDWGTLFTPNTAKTYWRPVADRVAIGYHISAQSTFVAQLNGNGTAQAFVLPSALSIPANLLQVGCRIGVAVVAKRTALAGAPGAASIRVFVGTTGSTADALAALVTVAATLNIVGSLYMENSVAAATVIRRTASSVSRDNVAMPGVDVVDDSTNFNTASAMSVTIGASAGFVIGDVVQLYEAGVWVVFP